jgi:hypothetical protein
MSIKEHIEKIIADYDIEAKSVKTKEDIKAFCEKWDIKINNEETKILTFEEFCDIYKMNKDELEIWISGNIIFSNADRFCDNIERINFDYDEGKLYIEDICVFLKEEDISLDYFNEMIKVYKNITINRKIALYLKDMGHEPYNMTCTSLKLLLDGSINEDKFIDVVCDISC